MMCNAMTKGFFLFFPRATFYFFYHEEVRGSGVSTVEASILN